MNRRAALRRAVRRLREIPVLGGVVRLADRALWWRVIRASGLVDAQYYAAQLGVRWIAADAALAHYVVRGFRRGLSVNPLFDEITAGGNLPEVFRVPAMYAYLRSDKHTVSVHPLWDAPAYARAVGGGIAGPLEHAWAHQDRSLTLTAGAGAERVLTVARFREEARAAVRGWRRPGASGTAPARAADVLLVRVIQERDRRYAEKLRQAVRLSERSGFSVVLALVGPDASQWATVRMLAGVHPSIRVLGQPRRASWDGVVRESVAGGAAGVVVVLDARAEFDDDDILALAAAAAEGRIAAPVHRGGTGTIASGGASVITGMPGRYIVLHDHPQEDLDAWGSAAVAVPALSGRSMAFPGPALTRILRETAPSRSADPLFAWTRRAGEEGVPCVILPAMRPVLAEPPHAFRHDRAVIATRPALHNGDEARVAELLRSSGFTVERWEASDGGPRPVLRWVPPHPGAQRWAIEICAPPGRAGEVWGDTHFAVGLARALRRAGHTVVIDAFGAAQRTSTYLDDVSVAIRGPYRIVPPATGIRMQWIISHPDEVTAREVAGFDRVFAASARWSASASRRWGVSIEPLLECTDTDQFHPRGLPRGDDIVFVGTARGIARPSVVAPLAAGIPVKVYGPDWRPFIPSSAVVAEVLPNEELPARYETASIVLNDQWPAMRRNGFIAMRPFDAVAVGARVISEDVDEIADLFRGAVVTYRDPDHLVELLRADPSTLFPSAPELAEIAAYVRRDHSFDARAATLIEAARQEAARPERPASGR